MAARYDLYENPDPQKSGKKQPLHARFVPCGKLTTAELCRQAALGSTFRPHELESALNLLTDAIVRQLEEGNTAELGDLGTVSLKLECRPVTNKSEIRSPSVHVKNITLRPGIKIKRRISSIELERNPDSWKSAELETDLRDRQLTKYFATHPYMLSSDYCKLRSCKPGMALKELNELIREGKIVRQGARSTSFYMPAEGYFRD